MRRSTLVIGIVGVIVIALAVITRFAVVPTALADPAPATTASDAFYVPPDPLPPGGNGDLIRSEDVGLLAGLGTPLPVAATRILYRSTDTHGVPVATSGIVLTPTAPWPGPGPRPLVNYLIGTHGAGDACAPSKLLTAGVTLDGSSMPMVEAFIADMAALSVRGYVVVVPDYQGLGTPGAHTYLQPTPEAHAVLDGARAAIRLGVTAPDAPIGIWGYSQGGGAAAAAAEQFASYAPDLNVKGSVVGAPPANPAIVMQNVDGKALAGVIGFFLNGLLASHPELTGQVIGMLNPTGIDYLHTTADECDLGVLTHWGFRNSKDLTVTGRPIMDELQADAESRAVLDSFVLGGIAPATPVMIMQNTNDDVVPVGQTRQLAADWCAKGSNVAYSSIDTPPLLPQAGVAGHAAGLLFLGQAVQWLTDRFTGVAANSNCQ